MSKRKLDGRQFKTFFFKINLSPGSFFAFILFSLKSLRRIYNLIFWFKILKSFLILNQGGHVFHFYFFLVWNFIIVLKECFSLLKLGCLVLVLSEVNAGLGLSKAVLWLWIFPLYLKPWDLDFSVFLFKLHGGVTLICV